MLRIRFCMSEVLPLAADRIESLLSGRRVVVCAGAGGVGKTTITSAIALAAAAKGRRVLCLTIDPARRLADSLGLSLEAGVEVQVGAEQLAAAGLTLSGTLAVAMLDTKRTFDELVERHASSREVKDRILQNRFYQHVSTSLAGTQSYMAMEKVLSLRKDARYDLIVLDTPPTAEALDFLDAPERLIETLDSPAMRWLVQAFEPSGGLRMRLLARGVAALLRTMARLTGKGFLENMAELVAELNELFGGFKSRAAEVSKAFRGPDFAYVLIAAPAAPALEEARFFAERLQGLGMRADAIILNRVHQRPERVPELEEVSRELARLGASGVDAAAVLRAQADESARADVERAALTGFESALPSTLGGKILRVPVMAGDVRGLSDLAAVSRALFAS